MKREYLWKVTLDGTAHEVYCRFAGDRYLLYADGVYVTEILRKSVTTMWYGMKKSITVFGKPCLFIVWDERPDLVMDGRLIGRGMDYEKALKRWSSRIYLGYGIVLAACVLLLIAVVVVLCLGMALRIGLGSILISLAASLTIGLWSGKHLWQLTHGENRPIILPE